MSLPLDELIKQFIKLTFVKYASTSENLKDLGHFLQQFAQGTTSEINPRKNERLSAIPVATNLYLSNCDSFFSVRIKLDLNFVCNILFLLTIRTHLAYIANGKKIMFYSAMAEMHDTIWRCFMVSSFPLTMSPWR